MNHSAARSLQRHVVDVILDASDVDHPINIALRDYPNLLEFYGSTYDYNYINGLQWTDPQTGKLNALCDEHMEELYAMHCLAHDLYDNHERDVGDILLARLNREAFLLYLEPDDLVPNDRAIELQDQKSADQQPPPETPRTDRKIETAQPATSPNDAAKKTDRTSGELTPPPTPKHKESTNDDDECRGPSDTLYQRRGTTNRRLVMRITQVDKPPPEPPPQSHHAPRDSTSTTRDKKQPAKDRRDTHLSTEKISHQKMGRHHPLKRPIMRSNPAGQPRIYPPQQQRRVQEARNLRTPT